MKLVKFKDGTFGVRRLTMFGWEYKDLHDQCFWWSRNSRYFPNCRGTEDKARTALEYAKDKGTPVKEKARG